MINEYKYMDPQILTPWLPKLSLAN